MQLSEGLLALLGQGSSCYLATSMPDGSPQLTQTWVDTGSLDIFEELAGIIRSTAAGLPTR